jgi:GNAT superfamily N-acetyltransferase
VRSSPVQGGTKDIIRYAASVYLLFIEIVASLKAAPPGDRAGQDDIPDLARCWNFTFTELPRIIVPGDEAPLYHDDTDFRKILLYIQERRGVSSNMLFPPLHPDTLIMSIDNTYRRGHISRGDMKLRERADFEIIEAVAEEERKACFAIRYGVYIDEFRWFEDDGTGLESDEHDAGALLLLARLDGRAAGTARLIFSSSGSLPSERHLSPDKVAGLRQIGDIAEISRITVAREFRSRGLAYTLRDRLFEEAGKRGIAALLIDTFIEGPMTWKRIWEESGFRPLGEAYPFTGPSGTFLSMVMMLQHSKESHGPAAGDSAFRSTCEDASSRASGD